MSNHNQLLKNLNGNQTGTALFWHGDEKAAVGDEAEMLQVLSQLDQPVFVITLDEKFLLVSHGEFTEYPGEYALILRGIVPSITPDSLGDTGFKSTYGTKYACYAGAMANGISSETLVIAMGKAGMMGSFGAGGLMPERIEKAIQTIQQALPEEPYAFNLLNSPNEPAIEARTVGLYIKYNIPVVEASAYLTMSQNLVWYRASGLSQNADGSINISHHIIAKLSRKEVAKRSRACTSRDA